MHPKNPKKFFYKDNALIAPQKRLRSLRHPDSLLKKIPYGVLYRF